MQYTLNDISPEGRVWIYASNRKFSDTECEKITEMGKAFVEQWTAHELPLKAAFILEHNLFLILAADETLNPLSGCGIDKSVAFIRNIESQFNVQLFNRTQIECLINNTAQIVTVSDLQQQPTTGIHFFDKTITNMSEFKNAFVKPIEHAWFYPKINTPTVA